MIRKDFDLIASCIDPQSRVLDLGCGDGSLLDYLKNQKDIQPQGIEKDWDLATATLGKGIPVLSGEIGWGLNLLESRSFDVIILSRTIQQLENPDYIINQMLEKGRTVVISFMNYGYWFNRFFFFFRGRRPINEAQPFGWYNSPDIRPLSINDFEDYCQKNHITILSKFFLKGDWEKKNSLLPNLFSGYAIYHLKRTLPHDK